MAKTNKGLVEYAKAQLGKPYWYGTFGQTASASLLASKRNQYPQYYKQSKYKVVFTTQYGKRVHDCVGLIKGYLWSNSPTATPKYNVAQDVSANGMLAKCKEKGSISTMPDIEGVLVFMDGHVGVYIGGGYVIEAQGHDEGVVKTALKSRKWKNWGKCPYITYEEAKTNTSKKSVEEIAKEVIAGKGDWGTGTTRKNKLTAAGYNYTEVQKKVNELLNTSKVTYFKKYTGTSNSIADALKSIGAEYSFAYRKKIATANGVKSYLGTPKQNTDMLNKLKSGKLIKP